MLPAMSQASGLLLYLSLVLLPVAGFIVSWVLYSRRMRYAHRLARLEFEQRGIDPSGMHRMVWSHPFKKFRTEIGGHQVRTIIGSGHASRVFRVLHQNAYGAELESYVRVSRWNWFENWAIEFETIPATTHS